MRFVARDHAKIQMNTVSYRVSQNYRRFLTRIRNFRAGFMKFSTWEQIDPRHSNGKLKIENFLKITVEKMQRLKKINSNQNLKNN